MIILFEFYQANEDLRAELAEDIEGECLKHGPLESVKVLELLYGFNLR